MRPILLVTAALATAVAGCGSSPRPAASHDATPTATATAAPITVKGRVGDTFALQGSGLHDNVNDHTKTRIRVTLQRVRGPFKDSSIPAGQKLIGVELRFHNVGKLRYEDAQPHGQLTLGSGESGKQLILIPLGGANPCDTPSVKLKTGQSTAACLAFEIPKASRPQAFEYVADDGYGDTGLWSLK